MQIIGADIGKLKDHSAICIKRGRTVERVYRLSLWTSYASLIDHLAGLNGELRIDAGGVGEAIVDALAAKGVRTVPITITGGKQAHRRGSRWSIPKKVLIEALAMQLRGNLIDLPDDPVLIEELKSMVRKGVKIEAAGSGHDDLVLALAMAAWPIG